MTLYDRHHLTPATPAAPTSIAGHHALRPLVLASLLALAAMAGAEWEIGRAHV